MVNARCLVVLLAVIGSTDATGFEWQLPDGISPPPEITANPISEAKVVLGEQLFAEPGLSVNGSTSCATCHQPELYFTDGLATSVGATGEALSRNTPSLWNVAYNVSFTWSDQGLQTLEAQHLIPLTSRSPIEMGATEATVRQLFTEPAWETLHRDAFPNRTPSLETVSFALAAYVRTLVRLDSPFDLYLRWDVQDALSADAKAGLDLFFSERLGCSNCHAGTHLAGPTHERFSPPPEPVFHWTSVSDATTAFRAPSLRYVGHTAPYMHDGSLPSLERVVRFYEGGGGAHSERLETFRLTAAERAQLIAFLEHL